MRPGLLLLGAAGGLGASIARTFGAEGYDVFGVSRSDRADGEIAKLVGAAGGVYTPIRADLTKARDLSAALAPIADRIEVMVHNANSLLIKGFLETSAEEFETGWRVACLGAAVAAQAVLPGMLARKSGTLIFSGATASQRGAARFASFASGKFALRGLAQSLAREFGPQGVHVAHVLLDGLIDEPQTDGRFGAAKGARMDPDAIAQAYLQLHGQPASIWTQELDLRPSTERF